MPLRAGIHAREGTLDGGVEATMRATSARRTPLNRAKVSCLLFLFKGQEHDAASPFGCPYEREHLMGEWKYSVVDKI